MPIVVVAHLHAAEGQEDAARAALVELVAATREEQGCESYVLHAGTEDPRDLVTIERWATVEALDAHFEAPHLQAVLARAPELLDAAPDIRRYEAEPVA